MADRKPIIKIDVDDKAFKQFKTSFDNLKKDLDKMPAGWKKVDAAVSKINKEIVKVEKSTKDTTKSTSNLSKYLKESEKRIRGFSAHAKVAGKTISAMVKGTAKISSNLATATKSLMKWFGIGGVLSAIGLAGGLFGFNNLANSASSTRFKSNSLGISAGDLKSANVNLGRLISDPSSFLSSIQTAQTDLSKKWVFRANGINPEGKSAADLAGPLIESAKKRFEGRNVTTQELDASGLSQFFSVGDVTNIQKLKSDEVKLALQKLDSDRRELAVRDESLKKYQDFNIALDRSKEKIENTFLDSLQDVAPELDSLTGALAGLIETVLKSKIVKEAIDGLKTGLNKLSKYLNSDDAKKDITTFLDALDTAAGAIYSFAKSTANVLNKVFGNEKTLTGTQYKQLSLLESKKPALAKALQNHLENPSNKQYADALTSERAKNTDLDTVNATRKMLGLAPLIRAGTATMPAGKPVPAAMDAAKVAYLSSLEKAKGLDKTYGPGVLDRLHYAESSRGANLVSGAGAEGPFGWMKNSGKDYGLTTREDRFDFKKSAVATANYLSDLIKWAGGDKVKAIAGYNWGMGNVAKQGADWVSNLPRETQREIAVVIYNNTGGNTFANVNQIAR